MKANLPTREPEILEYWKKINLYDELRNQSKGREKFVLHVWEHIPERLRHSELKLLRRPRGVAQKTCPDRAVSVDEKEAVTRGLGQ